VKTRCEVSATTIEMTQQNALYAHDGGLVVAQDCRFKEGRNGDYATALARGGSLELVACDLDSDAQLPLWAKERGRVTVKNCKIVFRGGNAIVVHEEGTVLTMKGGRVEGIYRAIHVLNGAKAEIDGTALAHAGADFGLIDVDGASLVGRNLHIEDATGYALVAANGAQVRLERTQLIHTAKSAIHIYGEGTLLEGEALTISNAREAGVLVSFGARLSGHALIVENCALRGVGTGANVSLDLRESLIAGNGEEQIFLDAGVSCTLSKTRIERGSAEFTAIAAKGATLHLASSMLSDNMGANIVASEGAQATLEDCQFARFGADAVRAVGENTAVALTRCTFSSGRDSAASVKEGACLDANDCEFFGGEAKYPEIVVSSPTTSMPTLAYLTYCTICDSPFGDLRVVRGGGLEATRCTLRRSRGVSVEADSSFLHLVECRIEAPGGKAVRGFNEARIELEGVEIVGAGDAEGAVLLEGASELKKMHGTLIADSAASGILVRSGSKVVADDCAVNGSGQCGVLVEGEGSNWQASRFSVQGAGADGLRIREGATAVFAESAISDAREAGARVEAATLTLTRTSLGDLAGAGVVVTGGGRAEITDGRFERVALVAAQATGEGSQIALLRTRLSAEGEAVVAAQEGGAANVQSCQIEAGAGVAGAAASGGTARVSSSVLTGGPAALLRATPGGHLDVEASRLLRRPGATPTGPAVQASGAGADVALRGLSFPGGEGGRAEATASARSSVAHCAFVGAGPGASPLNFEGSAGEVVDCVFRDLAGPALRARGASNVEVRDCAIYNGWGTEPAFNLDTEACVGVQGGWIQGGEARPGAATYRDCALGDSPPATFAPRRPPAAIATALSELDGLGLPAPASRALYALAASLAPDREEPPAQGAGVLLLTGEDADLRAATARAAAALYLAYGLIETGHVVAPAGTPRTGAPGNGAPGNGAPGNGASGSGASGSGAGGAILIDLNRDNPEADALDDLARGLAGGACKVVGGL
jgi:hypothetical protein